MDDLRAAFGARVRQLRESLGLSQEQLAERAEMHWTYISGIERGTRNPGLNSVGRLARALGLSLTELLEGVADTARHGPGGHGLSLSRPKGKMERRGVSR